MNGFLCDVATNIFADILFIILVVLCALTIYILVRLLRLDPMTRLFDAGHHEPTVIYVSGFEHLGLKTKCAVNAFEYESAVRLKETLRGSNWIILSLRFVRFLSNIAGIELSYPEWEIKIAPLPENSKAPTEKSLILIGDIGSNSFVSYFLPKDSRYKYNNALEKYEEMIDGNYSIIEASSNISILQKVKKQGQTIILARGYGEEQTVRAVDYLCHNWRKLFAEHGERTFEILL
jgi:hypothetical protein